MVVRARMVAANAVPDDACYSIGALVADTVALHQALDGDGQAVLIGHDWGAEAADGAAAFAPDRWRRVVTLGVPPVALDPVLFGDDPVLDAAPGAVAPYAAEEHARLAAGQSADALPTWQSRRLHRRGAG